MATLNAWADWFLRDRSGRIVIAQWPNAWLWGFGLFWLAAHVASGPAAYWAGIASRVLLAIWAADELLRGVNPWRRCLGAGVLLWLAMAFA